MKAVLASGSPRRREILDNAGAVFDILTCEVDEDYYSSDVKAIVRALSLKKALAVKQAYGIGDDIPIIAADTMVEKDDIILGKPADKTEAVGMLSMLSGTSHNVISGVTLLYSGEQLTADETTQVFFRRLSEEEIDRYTDTREPYDKAGGYGIQGIAGKFVRRIEGCYNNVVGLPLALLYDMAKQLGALDIFKI